MQFEKTRVSKAGGWLNIVGDPFPFARYYINAEGKRVVAPQYEKAVAMISAAPDLAAALTAMMKDARTFPLHLQNQKLLQQSSDALKLAGVEDA